MVVVEVVVFEFIEEFEVDIVVVVVIIFEVIVVNVFGVGLQTISLDFLLFMHSDLSNSKAFASFVISQLFENKEQKVLRTT